MENGSFISNAPRKGLSDITNLQHQPKVLTQDAKLLLQPASLGSKDYINKLQQENMMLMKVLADRIKVIELSGIELQKLRINFEKFQQQNLQLAQANNQLLLGLKEGTNKYGEAGESLNKEDGDYKPCNTNRRRQSKTLLPSNIKPVEAKEGVDNKRVCLRRQSARFKAEEPETTKDVFKVADKNSLISSPCDDKVHQSGPISSDSSVRIEHEEGCMAPRNEAEEPRRASTGRPLRRAAEKVQSYKEMKLNVKMRREL
ncbi:SHUGOSHIN 1 isoform X9 [Gossypium hirsutum]|uniref:SHUGOSHIN 1 isoform X9 n=1 Tax=Gossypium hirsutum TaxID=3635 RepID=A0ABM3A6Z7_GOSHI|nr:SHUGOSHIN 1-like isoform X9 [Gossypium hirsutum]